MDMLIRFTSHLCFASLLIAWTGVAQDDDAAKLLSELREKYGDVENMSLDFTQTTLFAVSKAVQEGGGTIVIGKGNRYRVTLDSRVIVSDGKTVWSWSKSNSQVIVDRFREDPAGLTPERLLTRIPGEYRAISTGRESLGKIRTTVLKLTPGTAGGQVKWFKLWVDEEELTVRKLQVRDIGDNEMTYALSGITINGEIHDSVFTFTEPPGSEVLDLR